MSKILALLVCTLVVCTIAQNVLPGAALLNLGMDFRQGGLVPAEERAKSQIFEYTYDTREWSPPGRPDLKFKYPTDTNLIPTGGTFEQTSSEIFKSYSQVVTVDIKGFNFGVSINVGVFGVGASYGREYGKIQERIKQEFKSITRGFWRSSVYKLIGRPHFLRKYHDDFEGTMDYIPSNPQSAEDYEKYSTALDYFGGFFQVDSVFGGQVKSYSFMNTLLTSNRDEKWVREQVTLSFRYKMFEVSGGGFRNRSEIKIDDFFNQNMKGDLAYHGGFRNLQNDKEVSKQWRHSIDDQSGLLDSTLRPISNLVKNDPVKKANLGKIVETYSLTGKVKSLTSELVNGKRKVPGYNVVGYGYDPVEMSIKQNVFEHDAEGFNKVSTYDEFVVPSSVKLIERTEVESKSLNVFSNSKQFTDSFVKKNVKQASLGNAKRSRDVYEFLKAEARGESKIELEQQISHYELKLNPLLYTCKQTSEKYMNPTLKKLIANLGTNYEDENVRKQYKAIIQEWGTDITIGTQMGGSFRSDVFFKNSLLTEKTLDQIKSEASAVFASYANTNEYSLTKDSKIPSWFSSAASSSVVVSGGRFRPTHAMNPLSAQQTPWTKFSQTVKSDPEALNFDIVSISVIIKDAVKAKLMDRAIQEYRQQINETNPMDETKLFTRDEIAEHLKF